MFGDVNRRRWRELNHLATVVQTLTRQVIRTHGALIQGMPIKTGRPLTTTRRVVRLVSLLPLAVWCVSLGALGLHERWRGLGRRWLLLLLQLGNARLGRGQLTAQFQIHRLQMGHFVSQGDDFFL